MSIINILLETENSLSELGINLGISKDLVKFEQGHNLLIGDSLDLILYLAEESGSIKSELYRLVRFYLKKLTQSKLKSDALLTLESVGKFVIDSIASVTLQHNFIDNSILLQELNILTLLHNFHVFEVKALEDREIPANLSETGLEKIA